MSATLFRYFGGLFARWILGLFFGATLLAFMIDAVEVIRANNDSPQFSLPTALAVSALRIPIITEQILPFAVLIGSIAAFMALSRRSELAVTRAAGVSVWQFAAPGVAVAMVIGAVATTLYNPLATFMKNRSDALSVASFGGVSSILSDTSSASWIRQSTDGRDVVLRVEGIADGGRTVLEPTFWLFGETGMLDRRIEAVIADLDGERWTLTEATVVDSTGAPKREPSVTIPTSLTPDQVRERLSSPEVVSFWRLPETISQAAAAGLPPYRFLLQFHVLLSRPLLLASMVLIAATVSLGLARAGEAGRMIIGGVGAGFVLYVVTEIARDLGSEGLVPPAFAAWTPGVVATLVGVTVLLYREDG